MRMNTQKSSPDAADTGKYRQEKEGSGSNLREDAGTRKVDRAQALGCAGALHSINESSIFGTGIRNTHLLFQPYQRYLPHQNLIVPPKATTVSIRVFPTIKPN